MGRATDPGENHDPGKDQRFTPNLTQAPRLENSLGGIRPFPIDVAIGASASGAAIRTGPVVDVSIG